MPYYYNRYRWRRRRPRRFWRRRFRRPFQRKFWRRRHWVRKRKLKKIRLSQYQPHYIKRLTITGTYPLVLSTKERLSNNLNCYLDSIAPAEVHGGGGFSICNFSLYSLYQENLQLRNWWSTSNDNMPLIRFLGCTVTLYRQAHLDYLFYYRNTYPMTASLTTYQSTNPQAMLLTKRTRIMACKTHNKNKKPYKKIRIRPPAQLQNKWYFQKEIAQVPLVQFITTACSLDRMYLNSTSISSTLGFVTLDTNGFMQRFLKANTTAPYQPLTGQLMFAAPNGKEVKDILLTQIILLGSVEEATEGTMIGAVPPTLSCPTDWQVTSNIAKKLYTAYNQSKYWGNPFMPHWFYGDQRILITNQTIEQLCKQYKNSTESDCKLTSGFVIKEQKYQQLRYNPFADKGVNNILYLLPIDSHVHSYGWDPPTDKDVVCRDLPLNVLLWGYLDFQRKCKEYNDIDTKCICVFQSPYVSPPGHCKFIVVLDDDFLHGNSPYFDEGRKTTSDYQNWHPKVRFQVRTLNAIACSGPATTKLPDDISIECHLKYRFHFKIGGEPAPMSVLKNPEDQPQWNIPNNFLQTTSLQNPTAPFEHLLWKFDERRGELTKRAAKRITENLQSETNLLPIAETATWCPTTLSKDQETSETTSSEEEETSTTEERLQQQRRKQKLLRKLINRMLLRLTTLE
nr:MAG: ORF1 [TTV-like mini virus]